MYSATGRRIVWIRPIGDHKRCSAYLMVNTMGNAALEEAFAAARTLPEQKALMRKTFQGAGWETARILDAVDAVDDFYLQEIAQVKLDCWSKGSVVVLGDSAWAPTPFSGLGTTAALIAGEVLAGEVARRPGDVPGALAAYEERLRPWITKAQKLAMGTPWIVTPGSAWGVTTLCTVAGILAWASKTRLGRWIMPGDTAEDELELPEYEEITG